MACSSGAVRTPSASTRLTFASELSRTFVPASLKVALDDQYLFACEDDPQLGDGVRTLDFDEPYLVFDGYVTAGEHVLFVEVAYKGYGHGIFSYLQGYRFRRVDDAGALALPLGASFAQGYVTPLLVIWTTT